MHKTQAEGTAFWYLTGNGDPSEMTSTGLSVHAPDPGIVARVRQAPDVRLVVFERMLKRTQGDVYYLHWNNGQDLVALDQRVIAGTYTDADFAASVKTTYQVTRCDACGSEWQTLVIPPGDPYPGAPGLLQRKIVASKIELCPACRGVLRQAVVKILGPATGSSP